MRVETERGIKRGRRVKERVRGKEKYCVCVREKREREGERGGERGGGEGGGGGGGRRVG